MDWRPGLKKHDCVSSHHHPSPNTPYHLTILFEVTSLARLSQSDKNESYILCAFMYIYIHMYIHIYGSRNPQHPNIPYIFHHRNIIFQKAPLTRAPMPRLPNISEASIATTRWFSLICRPFAFTAGFPLGLGGRMANKNGWFRWFNMV